MPNSKRMSSRRITLHEKSQGKCYWCGGLTRLPHECNLQDGEPNPQDMATIDHLDHKMSGDRGKYGHVILERTVLACRECNGIRGRLDEDRYRETKYV